MPDGKDTTPSVIIVDDDPGIRISFSGYLSEVGYDVKTAASRAEAAALLASRNFDVLLLDVNLPDSTGLDLTSEIRASYPNLVMVVITGQGDIPLAVEAMRRGADDFLTKPIDMRELDNFLRKSLEQGGIRRVHVPELRHHGRATAYWGESPAMQNAVELAGMAAKNSSPVLLQGETGCGKGLLARFIHDAGMDEDAPFVELNCSVLRGELLASELFGHKKGSFTGAVADREGLVGVADGGTLFLDEIGDMDLSVQSQFLKVLEDGQYRRLGENKPRKSSFRVVCASNRDLKAEAGAGRFRLDLFFRINVLPINIPPLRERASDIPGLAAHILAGLKPGGGSLSPEVLELLKSYTWPGNVRELKNALERATVLAGGGPLTAAHFPGLTDDAPSSEPMSPKGWDEPTVMDAVKRCGSVTKAAEELGVSRATLYRRIKSFGGKG